MFVSFLEPVHKKKIHRSKFEIEAKNTSLPLLPLLFLALDKFHIL